MKAPFEADPHADGESELKLGEGSASPGARSPLSGRLAAPSLLEALVRRLVGEEASVDVQLATDFGPATIYLRSGSLWDARIGQLSGEPALFRLFGLAYATFEVVAATADRPRTLRDPLDELLRQRRLRGDRWAHLVQRVPPLSTVMVGDLGVISTLSDDDLAEPLWELLDLTDGRRAIIEVIEDSQRDPVIALEQLVVLHERGIIVAEAQPSAPPGSVPSPGSARSRSAPPRSRAPDDSPKTERLAGPPPKPMGPSLGRYQIRARLGRGGVGTVYLGRIVEPDGFRRAVAIKVLRSHLSRSEQASRTLAQEAAIASRVQHPNVVCVRDAGTHQGQPYLVMDYVQGTSLAELLRTAAGAGSTATVVSIVLDVLAGLEAAHDSTDEDGSPLEIVHHDVSPHNILVGIDGVARLSDFGVAQIQRSVSKDPAIRYGKPAFTAPERVSGAPGDRRSDLFSLGVVLFNALSGESLFSGSEARDIFEQVLTRAIPRVSRSGRCSPSFDAVCFRALQRSPHKRYQSAGEMAADVRRVAREEGLALSPSQVSQWVRSVMGREVDVDRLDFLDAHRGARQAQEGGAAVASTEQPEPSRTLVLPSGAPRRSRTALKVIAVVLGLLVLAAAFMVPQGERPASPLKPPAQEEAQPPH